MSNGDNETTNSAARANGDTLFDDHVLPDGDIYLPWDVNFPVIDNITFDDIAFDDIVFDDIAFGDEAPSNGDVPFSDNAHLVNGSISKGKAKARADDANLASIDRSVASQPINLVPRPAPVHHHHHFCAHTCKVCRHQRAARLAAQSRAFREAWWRVSMEGDASQKELRQQLMDREENLHWEWISLMQKETELIERENALMERQLELRKSTVEWEMQVTEKEMEVEERKRATIERERVLVEREEHWWKAAVEEARNGGTITTAPW